MPPSELARYLARNLDYLSSAPQGAREVLATIGRLSGAYGEHGHLSDEEGRDLADALTRVRAIRAGHAVSEQAFVLELMLLGKLGRFAEAVATGRQVYAEAPIWASAIALANALRRSGDVTGSVDLFWAASRHDESDVTALLEIGDIHLDGGRWGAALEAYEAALAREPGQPWALPSSFYCRLRLSGDTQWETRLRELAQHPADKCGVAGALQQIIGGYTADECRVRAAQLLEGHRDAR